MEHNVQEPEIKKGNKNEQVILACPLLSVWRIRIKIIRIRLYAFAYFDQDPDYSRPKYNQKLYLLIFFSQLYKPETLTNKNKYSIPKDNCL